MTSTLTAMLTHLALMDSLSKASAGFKAHFSKGGPEASRTGDGCPEMCHARKDREGEGQKLGLLSFPEHPVHLPVCLGLMLCPLMAVSIISYLPCLEYNRCSQKCFLKSVEKSHPVTTYGELRGYLLRLILELRRYQDVSVNRRGSPGHIFGRGH